MPQDYHRTRHIWHKTDETRIISRIVYNNVLVAMICNGNIDDDEYDDEWIAAAESLYFKIACSRLKTAQTGKNASWKTEKGPAGPSPRATAKGEKSSR